MGGLTFNVTNSAGAVVWEEVSTRLIELSKISDNTSGLLQVNQPLSLPVDSGNVDVQDICIFSEFFWKIAFHFSEA